MIQLITKFLSFSTELRTLKQQSESTASQFIMTEDKIIEVIEEPKQLKL